MNKSFTFSDLIIDCAIDRGDRSLRVQHTRDPYDGSTILVYTRVQLLKTRAPPFLSLPSPTFEPRTRTTYGGLYARAATFSNGSYTIPREVIIRGREEVTEI